MGVKKLIKGKHKATRPIETFKYNEDDIHKKELEESEKRVLKKGSKTVGSKTGTNDSYV